MAYQTLDELDSIISTLNTLSNQSQRREEKRYSRDASIYDEFNSDLEKTYSNERLDVLEGRVNDYINKNSGQFNDLSVENFALLKDKIKFQREDNTAYQNGYQKLVDYGNNNFNIVNDFRNIQELTPDADGMVEYNGEKQNKNDLLVKQKSILQNNTKDFLDVQSNFVTSFGGQNGRLTNVSQRDKLATILGFDDIFKFGVQSVADEYFDPQEFEAYSNALNYKDAKYIDEFNTIRNQQQSNIRNFHEKTALETFSTVNTNLKSINAYNQFEDLFKRATGQDNYIDISMEDRKSAQAQLESLKQTAFPIQGNGKDGQVQKYVDLLSADGNFMDNSSSLSVSIGQLEVENNDLANQLNKINKTYLQTAGVGGLDQLGFSFNNPFLQNMAFGTKEKTNQQNQKESKAPQNITVETPQNITFEKGASIPTSSNINQENVDKNLVASQKPYDFNLKQDYMGTTYNNKPMGLPNKNEDPYFMEGESVPIKTTPGDSKLNLQVRLPDAKKGGLPIEFKKTNQKLSAVKTELSYKFQNKMKQGLGDTGYKNSIIGTNALAYDGKNMVEIQIADYNKNNNTIIDQNGNEYSQNDIQIQSMGDAMPSVKKANGAWWFYNPMINAYSLFDERANENFNTIKVTTGTGTKVVPSITKEDNTYIFVGGKWSKYLGKNKPEFKSKPKETKPKTPNQPLFVEIDNKNQNKKS